jgi:hypothetical protein
MFELDLEDWKELENRLALVKNRAIPFATKAMVNDAAFDARKEAISIVEDRMVLKNAWTKKSIRVQKETTLNIARQASKIGSTEEYMADQEFGTTKRGRGRHGVSIPTGYAAGQEGQRPRTRLAQKANRIQNIKLRRNRRGSSRKIRNMIAVKQAAARGNKYVFLDTGRKKMIAKVLGGKKRPKVKMVQDLSHKIVVIRPNPWLGTAVARVIPRMPGFYKTALIYQLRRLGVGR